MFTLIQAADFNANDKLLTATFRLRKKVFADQLNWDVPVTDDQEFDAYDNDKAQYLVWCSADRETVYGVVRLIPTSAPTLLFDVFDRTHDNDQSLVSDSTYEGTRMCPRRRDDRKGFSDNGTRSWLHTFAAGLVRNGIGRRHQTPRVKL